MNARSFCIFGDSVGKGVILSSSGRYTTAIPDINALTGRSDLTLDNYARFGFVTDKTLFWLEKCKKELSSHDAVFIEVGGNDCDFDWQSISDQPDREHLCNTPPEKFEEKYGELLKTVKDSGTKPYALNLPPIVAERYFAKISAGKCAANILKWLGGVQSIYRWQEMYSLLIEKITRIMNVPLIDIRSAFLARHDYENLICEDGVHPNSAGYELIYREVINQYRLITA